MKRMVLMADGRLFPLRDGLTSGEWVLDRANAGAKRILIVGPDAEGMRDLIRARWPTVFERIALTVALPQRDEFRIRGARYDATVCRRPDLWPLLGFENQPELRSILFEEMVTWSFGPILFLYENVDAPLVREMSNLISEEAAPCFCDGGEHICSPDCHHP